MHLIDMKMIDKSLPIVLKTRTSHIGILPRYDFALIDREEFMRDIINDGFGHTIKGSVLVFFGALALIFSLILGFDRTFGSMAVFLIGFGSWNLFKQHNVHRAFYDLGELNVYFDLFGLYFSSLGFTAYAHSILNSNRLIHKGLNLYIAGKLAFGVGLILACATGFIRADSLIPYLIPIYVFPFWWFPLSPLPVYGDGISLQRILVCLWDGAVYLSDYFPRLGEYGLNIVLPWDVWNVCFNVGVIFYIASMSGGSYLHYLEILRGRRKVLDDLNTKLQEANVGLEKRVNEKIRLVRSMFDNAPQGVFLVSLENGKPLLAMIIPKSWKILCRKKI